jgi:long-subunit acyl-CoA synthetase (AMP-forming)
VDRFFGAIGILILEGYGLTETAPLIGVRPQDRPVMGTVGPVIDGAELKIVDELGERLPHGIEGLIMVRGPQVMMGYYKKPDLTAKILGEDGWLDTGDLGMLTYDGRAQDHRQGEGHDRPPRRRERGALPIEQKLAESEYIVQAVVLGQDQKYLAALVVPNQEAVTAWAEENHDSDNRLRKPLAAARDRRAHRFRGERARERQKRLQELREDLPLRPHWPSPSRSAESSRPSRRSSATPSSEVKKLYHKQVKEAWSSNS